MNALAHLLAILDELDASKLTYDHDDTIEGLPRIMVGQVDGGKSPSRVPDLAVAKGDIRIGPGMNQETLMADLKRVDRLGEVAHSQPGRGGARDHLPAAVPGGPERAHRADGDRRAPRGRPAPIHASARGCRCRAT